MDTRMIENLIFIYHYFNTVYIGQLLKAPCLNIAWLVFLYFPVKR